MGVRRLSLGKSRIEALSDGVFSIAMTLLVLKLEVPEVMHHSSNQAMLQQLLALTPAFLTYAVTFLIAGGFWYIHHLTFLLIRNVDSLLIWINLLFLMFVALLPFSAGLMGHLLVHPFLSCSITAINSHRRSAKSALAISAIPQSHRLKRNSGLDSHHLSCDGRIRGLLDRLYLLTRI